jgi:hypothetical protein
LCCGGGASARLTAAGRYWVPVESVSSVKHIILQHLPVFRMWQVRHPAPPSPIPLHIPPIPIPIPTRARAGVRRPAPPLERVLGRCGCLTQAAGRQGAGDSQLVNSVYFDNRQMQLYHGRMDKTPGAIALRLRWCGRVGSGWGHSGALTGDRSRAVAAGRELSGGADLQGENCRGGQFGGAQAGRCEEARCCVRGLRRGRWERETLSSYGSERKVRVRESERVWQALVGAQGGGCVRSACERERLAGTARTSRPATTTTQHSNNNTRAGAALTSRPATTTTTTTIHNINNNTRAGTARTSRPSSSSARRTSTRGPATSASRSASRCRSTSSCPTSTGRTRWAQAGSALRIRGRDVFDG